MRNNTDEKSLINTKQTIFFKIKDFFKNLFCGRKDNVNIIENMTEHNNENNFIETLKNIEDEETKLLKLQKQYRNGEIKESELSKEQEDLLVKLYDRQINELRSSNERRKQKILQYIKNM